MNEGSVSISPPSILATRGLTKKFDDFTAISDVSVQFAVGQIHAVLGENGAGKSTLMKLLFGLHEPTSGEIRLHGKSVVWSSSLDAIAAGLGMVQQHFTLVEPMSAIDNIMLGAEVCQGLGRLNRAAAIERIEKLLPSPSLRVPWLTEVANLTVGQKQRVEILKLLFRESQILFLDEPTAVLTPQEIRDLFDVLRQLKTAGKTVVLITHKINEVMRLCDTYTVLRQGRVTATGKVVGTSSETIVEAMIGRRLEARDVKRIPVRQSVLITARDVTEREEAGSGRLKRLSLQVHAGEIVGIAGVEGSGQSRLVDALLGLSEFQGDLEVLGHAVKAGQTLNIRERGLALVPEDRHRQGLWLEESCFANMTIGIEKRFLDRGLFNRGRIESETSKWAEHFDVRASSLGVPVGTLSGGNQQKIIFARELSGREPKLLICHQPTRGVDLGAIDLIHQRLLDLRNEGLGILVLSSELDELLYLADRIYVFFDGRVSGEFSRTQFDSLKIGAAMTGAIS
jgi:simple sugar transport system ATP-binding protein